MHLIYRCIYIYTIDLLIAPQTWWFWNVLDPIQMTITFSSSQVKIMETHGPVQEEVSLQQLGLKKWPRGDPHEECLAIDSWGVHLPGVVESPSCVSNFFGHRIWMPFPTDRHRIFFRATHILEEPIRVSYVLASSSLALCILPVKEDTDVKTENQWKKRS